MPPQKTLTQLAQEWLPNSEDSCGKDKKRFIQYLIANCNGVRNARPLNQILTELTLSQSYSRENFQHLIVVPLREDKDIFIGTCSRGLYFISSPDDAFTTMSFYTNRLRAERKHLRNLKAIVSRSNLFKQHKITFPANTKKTIYFDESGTPSLADKGTNPFFIVCAVIIDAKKAEALLAKKLDFIRRVIGKPETFEFHSNRLTKKEYILVLRELSTLDYEFAAVCFIKAKLTNPGFRYPKTLYKYAFGFLLNDVLDEVGEAHVVFDEYGGRNSRFQREFFKYIKNRTLAYPVNKIGHMEMHRSDGNPFLQMADLLAGTIKNEFKQGPSLLPYVADKQITVQYFPYPEIPAIGTYRSLKLRVR